MFHHLPTINLPFHEISTDDSVERFCKGWIRVGWSTIEFLGEDNGTYMRVFFWGLRLCHPDFGAFTAGHSTNVLLLLKLLQKDRIGFYDGLKCERRDQGRASGLSRNSCWSRVTKSLQ